MIRRSCVACGRSINRTDQFFEPSDGTLCQDCKARLAIGARPLRTGAPGAEADFPALVSLPVLAASTVRHR